MKRFRFIVPFLLTAMLGLAACGSQEQQETASVNTPIGPFTVQVGEPIEDSTTAAIIEIGTSADTLETQTFRQRMKMASKRMQQMQGDPSQVRRQVVEGFAGRQLLTELNRQFIQMADSIGIQADTAQVNQQFQEYRDRFPNEQVYQQQLARQNLTEDSLRQLLTQQVRFEELRQRTMDNVAEPTSSEIDSARRAGAEEIELQHILLRVPRTATPEQSDSVEQRAQALIDSLQSGADFAALAQRHSADQASAQEGGSIGWVSRDSNLVAPFKEAAFNLPEQQSMTSEPVKTRFGYHIIRVTDRRTGDMAETPEARQQIVSNRGQEAWQKKVEGQRDRVQATLRLNQDVVETELSSPEEASQDAPPAPPASS